MQVLIDDKIILNYPTALSPISSALQGALYKGEWTYCSSPAILGLLNSIYYPSADKQSNLSIFGLELNGGLSIDDRQSIRGQIRHIHGRKIFPDGITIEEEINENHLLISDNIDIEKYKILLDSYGMSMDLLCQSLSHSQRIILDILMALDSDISLLILEGIVDSIIPTYKNKILDVIYHTSLIDGLTVLIFTDNIEIKNKYLGRNF
ncbi:hypothetical protein N9L92_02695 [Saprospiraceae bacterium]|nr:hypothetical protein [Saprospiraceae bacterium]